MKYLRLFENNSFSKEDIKRFIERFINKGFIKLNIPLEELLNKFKYYEIGSFKEFVENGAEFISYSNTKRMFEIISKFKDLGLNTDKAENLLKYYNEYYDNEYLIEDLEIKLQELYDDEEVEKEKINNKIERLNARQYELSNKVEEFEKEIKILAKKAQKLI